MSDKQDDVDNAVDVSGINRNQNVVDFANAMAPGATTVQTADDGGAQPEKVRGVNDDNVEQQGNRVSIVVTMMREKTHPVLVVGARGSGKTHLEVSLIRFVKCESSSKASVSLIDVALGGRRAELAMAKSLFDHHVEKTIDGVPIPRTAASFYAPIELQPAGERKAANFALFEGRGEDFHANFNSDSLFDELSQDVVKVLKGYPNPISIIYVAPYVDNDNNDYGKKGIYEIEQEKRSDLAIRRFISSYNKNRKKFCEIDKHLFVFSKWDAHPSVNFMTSDKDKLEATFHKPSVANLEQEIQKKFSYSWGQFNNINAGANQDTSKFVMPYCAALFDDDGNQIVLDAEQNARLNYFPKAVLDWLYRNSTGEALYDDRTYLEPLPWSRGD